MTRWFSLLFCSGLFLAGGCAQDPPVNGVPAKSGQTASAEGAPFVLNEEPEKARDVIAARKSAGDGDEVLVVGRIGGGMDPWIDGRAAFTIVDNSLKACSDIPGDACKTPWDYCCETDKLPSATALVKIVDQRGELVKTAAKNLLNVKELSTVVVKGKAERDEDGNLTILASGVYVKRK